MNHDVYISIFCPKDSGGDKSLLAFHSHMWKKEKEKKKKGRKKPTLQVSSLYLKGENKSRHNI